MSPTRCASNLRGHGPAPRRWPTCRSSCRGARAGRHSWRQRMVARRGRRFRPFRRAIRSAGRDFVPPRVALSEHASAIMPGEIGIGPNPKLKARIENADLVLLVGGRMSEMPSQSYTLFAIPNPRQSLVHVHASAEELGRVYHPALAIHATPDAFCASLDALQPPQTISWAPATARRQCRLSRLDRRRAADARRDAIRRSPHAIARHPAGRRHFHERRRQFRDRRRALPARPAVRRTACAELRLDGLRAARRRRRETTVPRAHGRMFRRRRRLPDERPGVRDRRAI